jgi:hypothetical protein
MAGQFFIAANDHDEVFFEQFLDGIITAYTADRFNFRFCYRLLVSNNGQCFQSCNGKTL